MAKKKMKVRKISITSQIMIILLFVFLIGDVTIGFVSYRQTGNTLLSEIRANAESTARCVAASIDADAFANIRDADSEEFQEVYDAINVFKQNADIEYAYSLKEENGGVCFVVDTDPDEPGELGEEYDYKDAMRTAFSGTAASDAEPYTDEWGSHISAYAPILRNGTVVGIAVVDLSATAISNQSRAAAVSIVIVCAAILVLLVITLLMISSKLRKGFVTLDSKISDLTDGNGDLTKKVMINSGDEFEVIAGHVNSFIGEIYDLVSQVSNSASCLITSSADMKRTVESNTLTISGINDNISNISAIMQECSASSEKASEDLESSAKELVGLTREIESVENFVSELRERAVKAKQQAVEEEAA